MLEIEFKVSELRRLIDMSDKNHDGKIDFNEFHDMLYTEHKTTEEGFEVISEEDDD